MDSDLHKNNYDDLFKEAVSLHFPEGEINWQQLKAQGRAESDLNPQALSIVGAKGIMQLMPETARLLGVEDPYDPKQSIMGGAAYLKRLYQIFKEEVGPDRWYFSLASYNAGPGHIISAQKKAREKGLVIYDWGAMAAVLGEITGKHSIETINYVGRIKRFYEMMK